jgi:type II secretory pathway pseudopilin PulG
MPVTWLRGRLERLLELDGESGITLIELMVAMAAGVIVMAAITTAMLFTIRDTGRVTSHVEANQRARVAMTRVVRELNSACFFPQVTPVMEGSDGDTLIFLRANGEEGEKVAPTPVRSEIELLEGDLVQRDTNPSSGTGKTWTFPTAPGAEEVLLQSVSPVSETAPIFSYYTYENGQISATPLPTPLSTSAAGTAVQVDVAFSSSPRPPIQEDENAATSISDSVLLRLTPPSYLTSTANPPCE